MKILEKILFATDFTHSDNSVFESVKRIAITFESQITVVHVLPKDIGDEKASKLLTEIASKKLDELNNSLKEAGVKTDDWVLEYGNHLDRIISISEKIDANLILIGAGEKRKDDAFKLGTTAARIIETSDKPVLVIKNESPPGLRTVICPVNFSEESERALKNAIILTRRYNANLIVFSSYDMPYTGSLEQQINWGEQAEIMRSKHLNEFNLFLERFNFDEVNWSKEIRKGNAATEILESIKTHNADLLIIGTSGKKGLNKFIMGSVTEKVVREVPCSFITMKAEDFIELKIEKSIQDIDTHNKMAKELMEDGFYNEALEQYKICLGINGMHIPTLVGLAKVYNKLDNKLNAEKYKRLAKQVMDRFWDAKIEEEIRHHRI